MNFQNRIKKEMTEGIVRAILIDAGYRVADIGIEKILREVECLNKSEYQQLDFSKQLRTLPDFCVMDKDQTQQTPVEVKYRSGWSNNIFTEIEEQVRHSQKLVLVYLNSKPDLTKDYNPAPSSYLRCCELRWSEDKVQACLNDREHGMIWENCRALPELDGVWWRLRPIQVIFPQVNEHKNKKAQTLTKAIEAIQGILNT